MLRQRLIYGTLMMAGVLALFYLDARLDQVSLGGTPLQSVFFGRLYLPAGLPLLAVMLVLIPLGAIELSRIFNAKGIAADPVMLSLAGVIGCLLAYATPSGIDAPSGVDAQRSVALLGTVIIGLFLVGLVRHSWGGHTQGAVAVGGATVFALVYMGLLPGFFLLIRRWHSAWLILGLLVITKACDIGAYFTGRFLGRHKLIPWLSPNKTWEGLIGGMVTSAAVATLLAWLAQHLQSDAGGDWHIMGSFRRAPGLHEFAPVAYPLWAVAVCGLLIGLVGQAGDLTASLFKRDAGMKDSGQVVPGFGGVLDIIDSPWGVAPLAYWLVFVLDRIAVGA